MTSTTYERMEAYIALGESLESHGVTLEELQLLATSPVKEKLGIMAKELAIEAKRAATPLPLFTPNDDPIPLESRYVKELGLGPKILTALERQHIRTLQDLTDLSGDELASRTNLGEHEILIIRQRLDVRGLSLKSDELALH